MIKLRGFGGKTEFWDHNLETFTLMAGLAAVTSKVQIYATAATLVMPPAIVARMASTIDSISKWSFWFKCRDRLASTRIYANGDVARR